mmetsp:Transcript_31094/g.101629  ORF Transcript_31094/g.101629 Transcript_31094/m.101629 type:complete len:236 (+) Transcript_31094:122-829(+)
MPPSHYRLSTTVPRASLRLPGGRQRRRAAARARLGSPPAQPDDHHVCRATAHQRPERGGELVVVILGRGVVQAGEQAEGPDHLEQQQRAGHRRRRGPECCARPVAEVAPREASWRRRRSDVGEEGGGGNGGGIPAKDVERAVEDDRRDDRRNKGDEAAECRCCRAAGAGRPQTRHERPCERDRRGGPAGEELGRLLGKHLALWRVEEDEDYHTECVHHRTKRIESVAHGRALARL